MSNIINFKKYKYLLFDLDNTLLDFNKSSHLAFSDMIKHFNIEHSENLYDIYQPINAKYWHYFEKRKITVQELRVGRFKEFIETIHVVLDEHEMAEMYLEFLVHHSSWIDGAEELLKKLSRSHHVNLITNGISKTQHLRLEKHNMKQYFNHIFISEELGVSKPNSLFFENVHLKLDKAPKNEFLVIGDNPNSDIKGGRNYGFRTCFFDYKKDKKQHAKANYKVTSWQTFLNSENV